MGTPETEELGGFRVNPFKRPSTERRPSQLVSEAIRRDLLTLADLPGQEEVRSTYHRELTNGLKPA